MAVPTNTQALSQVVSVFVSSTWLDLQPERAAVEGVLRRFRDTEFIGMEYFGSRAENTETASVDEVLRSHLYIGIIGSRYGSGITESEYRAAREKGLDCLIYARRRGAEEAPEPELERFAAVLRRTHTVSEFSTPAELAVKVAADLHNWIFNQWLTGGFIRRTTDGLATLPTDYATRVQNFLHEYLGSADRPVPFGGRSAEMAALDEWLESGRPFAVVAAPAGRGKSALVARWARNLTARPGTQTVFFPISIRFRTNLASVVFTSLAARLARIHGEELRGPSDLTPEVCRGLVASYLRRGPPDGMRLVLVLDGLDEAADWEAGADLFPRELPERVHVLVTARYRAGDVDARAWMSALGWHERSTRAIDLGALTEEGLRDVLMRMGAPLDQVVAKVDIVAELFRLSKGDPLLVRLYAEDLWSLGMAAVRLRPDDLAELRAGLGGYFERWWKEQQSLWAQDAPLRQKSVQTVLNLLSCSLGPLLRQDLMELAPAEDGLNTWTLEAALQPLARFVIGDGKGQGYVFSHPRLSEYFYELLTPGERHRWEARFAHWGEQTVAALESGQLAPEDSADYLIQYYGAHLERCRAGPGPLMRLVSDGWRKAWLAHEGAYNGFLNDVERAWRAVEMENARAAAQGRGPTHLADALACALAVASVRSLSANVRPEMLRALVEKEVWTGAQALAFVRRMPAEQQRCEGLRAIAEHLSPALVGEAVSVPVAHLPVELAGRLAECGRANKALEIASALDWDNEALAAVLVAIGPHLNEYESEYAARLSENLGPVHRVAARLAVANSMDGDRRRAFLEAELQQAISEADESGIHRIAPLIGDEAVARVHGGARLPWDRFDALVAGSALEPYLPAEGRGARVRGILEGLEAARGEEPGERVRRTAVLGNLLPYLDPETRERAIDEITEGAVSGGVLRRCRPYLTAQRIRRLLQHPANQDRIRELVPLLAERMDPRAWEHVIDWIFSDGIAATALAALHRLFPEDQFEEIRRRVFEEPDEYERLFGIWAIAPRLPLQDVREAVEDSSLPETDIRACGALAVRLVELGAYDDALGLLRRVRDDQRRARILIAIARAAPPDSEFLVSLIEEAAGLPQAPDALAAISREAPAELLRAALAAVQRIGDIDAQMRARQDLALILAREGAFNAAQAVASRIEGPGTDEWKARYADALAGAGLPKEALEVAGSIREAASRRDGMWAALANIDDAAVFEGILRRFLDAAESGDAETAGIDCGVALHFFPADGKEAALRFVCSLHDPKQRAEAISALGVRHPEWRSALNEFDTEDRDSESPQDESEQQRDAWVEQAAVEPDFGPSCRMLLESRCEATPAIRRLIQARLASCTEFEVEDVVSWLAPGCDEEVWDALKAAVDRMARSDRKIECLRVLIQHGSGARQKSAAAAALDAAGTLGSGEQRYWLNRLAEVLPAQEKERAWLTAWRLAVSDSNASIYELSEDLLAAPEGLVERGASLLLDGYRRRGISRWVAVNAIRRLLPEEHPARQIIGNLVETLNWLRDARQQEDEEGVEWSLARLIAEGLPRWGKEGVLDRAFEMACGIKDPGARAHAIGEFLDTHSSTLAWRAQDECLRLAALGRVQRVRLMEVLRRTAGRATAEWKEIALHALREDLDRAQADRGAIDPALFSELASRLPLQNRYELWAAVVRQLSLGSRPEFLASLGALTAWWKPGNAKLASQTGEVLEKVVAWWP